ncbi:MAG: hypothetical protein ACYST9_00060 [Planctomycetota bacterium]|jgi:hypothetical protein
MKQKSVFSVFLTVLLVAAMAQVGFAVSVAAVDNVRNKSVLASKDFQIIDKFIADAVDELLGTTDFTSIAKIRTVISSRSSSETESSQAQYQDQFSESSQKHITRGLKEAEKLTPAEHSVKVKMTLLVLSDSLKDAQLIEPALSMIGSGQSPVVNYWAVRCVTNPNISGQRLVSDDQIVTKLLSIIDDSPSEVFGLMVEFAAKSQAAQAGKLIGKIADVRMKQYADWTVENELLDVAVLKALFEQTGSSKPDGPAMGRRFGQLYSYVVQRYIKGHDYLDDSAKQGLASVMVDIERTSISQMLGVSQSIIKKSIEKDAFEILQQEHDRLLGLPKKPGQLSTRLGFDYEKNADGSKRTAPKALPELPKS